MEEAKRYVYSYVGPVLRFGKVIDRNWKASTLAVSEKKARSNLTFRYKKEHRLVPDTNIVLAGKIMKGE